MTRCKHCKVTFDIEGQPKGWMANHSRWCLSNPKREQYNIQLINARSAKKRFGNQYTKAKKEEKPIPTSPHAGKPSTFKGKTHSAEVKEQIRQKALASSHRRLKKSTIKYNEVILDSSWELALAKRLDDLKIKWIRPQPIQWVDDQGIKHHYFADFYLVDYNLYIDPKNPFAVKVQKEKLAILKKVLTNLIILETLSECKNFTPVSQPPSKRSLTE
jgi:hypothetical protein